MDIKVLGVLAGHRVIVSSKGRMRVVSTTTGEVIEELLTAEEAAEMVAANARCYRDGVSRLRAERYGEAAVKRVSA